VQHFQVYVIYFRDKVYQKKNQNTKNNVDSNKDTLAKSITLPYSTKIMIDVSCAFFATSLSSPFNHVRNIQYSTSIETNKIRNSIDILSTLYRNGLKQGPSKFDALKYYFWRLRIGWGTLRVAVGMSFTSLCYEWIVKYAATHE